jgi:hypothetical protein
MTEPDHETRPISVAELLARNGTIGAPPVGGRRRRRRGNSDAVTVAELTGEIPAVEDEEDREEHRDDAVEGVAPVDLAPTNGTDEHTHYFAGSSVAEQMRPDPVVDDGDDDHTADLLLQGPPADEEDDDLPSYLRSIRAPLFGGPTRDDRDDEHRGGDLSSRTTTLPEVPPETTTAKELDEIEPPTTMQKVLRAGLVVLQSIVAVAFGAGLFIAFDQLWKWNNIVALVLSVLVILGLVVAVRVVRKTEDIASTLIAVAVGALVTLGPLALLQSG